MRVYGCSKEPSHWVPTTYVFVEIRKIILKYTLLIGGLLQEHYKNVKSNLTCTMKVSEGAKIRSRYNQVPQPTQDTNGKVTNSQLDTTNESQEVSPFPAVDHKAHINRRTQRHSNHKTEKTQKIRKRSTTLEQSVKYFTGGLKPVPRRANVTLKSDVEAVKGAVRTGYICLQYGLCKMWLAD